MKALIAASQCPKCGHLFEMRDGFGEMLPLAYCSTCESYYPESVGSCKWCGTKPERAPIAPHVWKGIGVAALVVLGFGAWLAHDPSPKEPLDARARAAAQEPEAMSVPAESIASNPTVAPAGSVASAPAPVPIDTVAPRTTTIASAGSIAQDSVIMPADTFVPRAAPRMVAAATPLVKPVAKAPVASSPKSRASPRWINSVARSWVVVRADASKGARIVASIGPNSRVQLGESRGSWRRIRARGIAGWVEHRAFFTGSRAPKKLAAR